MAAAESKNEDQQKFVRHMSYEGHMMLSVKLEPVCPQGNNYKDLASKLGFTVENIRYFETKPDPVMFMLNDPSLVDLTISKLRSCLLEIQRYDVVEDLEPFAESTLTPTEYEKKYAERERTGYGKDEKNLTALPDDIMYDAFLCYTTRDLNFAKTVLKTLENEPYHFKLCINFRDILPGSHELSAIVKVIEKRCRKVIVIISEHFEEDVNADFQAKIALGLSPGCKEKRLIPIVMDNREFVPDILKHITHLDYSNILAREYFWRNLAKALGYRK